ncbi:MAG: SET domain-containing protein [Patescibacteria group bacterium]
MLKVKASAGLSQVNGIGLFAEEKIPKGTVTWQFNPDLDIVFDPEKVAKMPKEQQELFDRFAFLSKKTGKYIYSIDDSRFCNHSAFQNNIDFLYTVDQPEGYSIANREIEKGEELLVNYRQFDEHDTRSDEPYLNN